MKIGKSDKSVLGIHVETIANVVILNVRVYIQVAEETILRLLRKITLLFESFPPFGRPILRRRRKIILPLL